MLDAICGHTPSSVGGREKHSQLLEELRKGRLVFEDQVIAAGSGRTARPRCSRHRLPCSNGTRASSRECMTRVGTVTWPSSAVTSKSPGAIKLRTAFSGEVEMRCSSLNQSACSLCRPE